MEEVEIVTGKYHDRATLVDAVTTFADLGKEQLWIANRCGVTKQEVYGIIKQYRNGEYKKKATGFGAHKMNGSKPKPPVLQERKRERSMKELIAVVEQWHEDRNLIEGSTDSAQLIKLQEELDELKFSVANGKDVKDDIGDMMVVLINIAKRNKVTMTACLAHAYDDIKDRKGKMVDGIFVKEQVYANVDEIPVDRAGRPMYDLYGTKLDIEDRESE
jgi:transposase